MYAEAIQTVQQYAAPIVLYLMVANYYGGMARVMYIYMSFQILLAVSPMCRFKYNLTFPPDFKFWAL